MHANIQPSGGNPELVPPRSRPPIPPDVALKLRQEAGFGCCKCGGMIYQYHHIIPWEAEHHYRFADMMLLCPTHHDEATKGAMREPEQRRLKQNPHNIRKRRAQGLIKVHQDTPVAKIGPVLFKTDGALLVFDSEMLLGMSTGPTGILEISLNLYDKHDNQLLRIDKNEWINPGEFLPWDIEAGWEYLKIREKKKHVLFSIDARKEPMVMTMNCWRKNISINMQPNLGITIGRPIMTSIRGGKEFKNVCLNVDTQACTLTLADSSGRPAVVMRSDSKLVINGPHSLCVS